MRPRFGWALIPIVLAAGHWQSALAQEKPTASAEPSSPQIQSETGAAPFDVPAGTRVVLQLTGPVWTKSATPGIRVYARSVFPVAINNAMVIPAGTYVEGIVDAVKKPTRRSNRAQFQMHFTKWIFANGYTVQFVGSDSAKATANLLVEVSYASDVLLDNGTQIEMTVQKPILLDRASIAKAAQVARPLAIGSVKSATRCRPFPGTPGTSDTVIPGTPGTSGTPPVVIPGGPGMPDTVIPGTSGTPGTPPTVLPGSPGTPAFTCPAPPIVLSSSNAQWSHTQNFDVAKPFVIGGVKLRAGKYEAAWTGESGLAPVEIVKDGVAVASALARISPLGELSKRNAAIMRENPDGTATLVKLMFGQENIALWFNEETARNNGTGQTRPQD